MSLQFVLFRLGSLSLSNPQPILASINSNYQSSIFHSHSKTLVHYDKSLNHFPFRSHPNSHSHLLLWPQLILHNINPSFKLLKLSTTHVHNFLFNSNSHSQIQETLIPHCNIQDPNFSINPISNNTSTPKNICFFF